MRKADYITLAAIIAKKRADMSRVKQHVIDDKSVLVATAAEQCARDIAEDFARLAKIDKRAFLAACGLTY